MKKASFKRIGEYQLLQEIGSGSYSRVFRASKDGDKQFFAIKMINKENLNKDQQRQIENETTILQKLNSPYIIKLYDFKVTTNNYYLVFEFCEKGDLDKLLRKEKRLKEDYVFNIVNQLKSAMQELHHYNIVHRDLKLANILLDKDSNIKLADFGFARHYFSSDDRKTIDDHKVSNDRKNEFPTIDANFMQSLCGTPITMAPEILKRQAYDDKCDIWSLGVIIYQMLYGCPPFLPKPGQSIFDLQQIIENGKLSFPEEIKVSQEAKQLLRQMLVVDTSKRIGFNEFFNSDWLTKYKNSVNNVGVGEGSSQIKQDITSQQYEESKQSPSNPNNLSQNQSQFQVIQQQPQSSTYQTINTPCGEETPKDDEETIQFIQYLACEATKQEVKWLQELQTIIKEFQESLDNIEKEDLQLQQGKKELEFCVFLAIIALQAPLTNLIKRKSVDIQYQASPIFQLSLQECFLQQIKSHILKLEDKKEKYKGLFSEQLQTKIQEKSSSADFLFKEITEFLENIIIEKYRYNEQQMKLVAKLVLQLINIEIFGVEQILWKGFNIICMESQQEHFLKQLIIQEQESFAKEFESCSLQQNLQPHVHKEYAIVELVQLSLSEITDQYIYYDKQDLIRFQQFLQEMLILDQEKK